MQWFPKLIILFCAGCLSVACSTNKKSELAQSSNPCEQLLSFNTDDNNVKIKMAVVVPAGPVPPARAIAKACPACALSLDDYFW